MLQIDLLVFPGASGLGNLTSGDHLEIIDGDGKILLEKSCGSVVPEGIVSSSNTVKLSFKTDTGNTLSGWRISWCQIVPGGQCSGRLGKMSHCDQIKGNDNFTQHPNCNKIQGHQIRETKERATHGPTRFLFLSDPCPIILATLVINFLLFC